MINCTGLSAILLACSILGSMSCLSANLPNAEHELQVSVWLAPAPEYQWRFWEANAALAKMYDVAERHIPVFQPHATLCAGKILYNTEKERETKLRELRATLSNNRAWLEDVLQVRLRLVPQNDGPASIGKWWSQFVFLPFRFEDFPEIGKNKARAESTFKVVSSLSLSYKKTPTGEDTAEVMPHASLMYCDHPESLDSDIGKIRNEVAKRFEDISEVVFDAIQIATPEPCSTDWRDLVANKPDRRPVQWRVLYSCPIGSQAEASSGSLTKVVAGGQTGADTAALRAAMESGVATGGWASPDGSNQAGKIPAEFLLTNTKEARSPNAANIERSMRTELNAQDSDGTLILRRFDRRNSLKPNSSDFSDFDFSNPNSLADRLCNAVDPLCVWLLSKFQPADRAILQSRKDDKTKSKELAAVIAANFNRLMADEEAIYELLSFDGFKLSEYTGRLMQSRGPGDGRVVKRRLLEDAFPEEFYPTLDSGTLYTAWAAAGFARPVMICDPMDQEDVSRVADWLRKYGIKTLNVGGPAERTIPGIGEHSYVFLLKVFSQVKA